jgi:hypothetical protein
MLFHHDDAWCFCNGVGGVVFAYLVYCPPRTLVVLGSNTSAPIMPSWGGSSVQEGPTKKTSRGMAADDGDGGAKLLPRGVVQVLRRILLLGEKE